MCCKVSRRQLARVVFVSSELDANNVARSCKGIKMQTLVLEDATPAAASDYVVRCVRHLLRDDTITEEVAGLCMAL
jgi:hypothetical protein